MQVQRTDIVLRPDASRVFFRPFELHHRERILRIVARICAIPEKQAATECREVLRRFEDRHIRLRHYLLERFNDVREHLLTDQPLSEARRLLIGAYFTQEYSLEAAAIFNPSIVPHPDQSCLPRGSLRFVLSLRAVGEGHISSIIFRTGVIDDQGTISINEPTPYVTAARPEPNPVYEKPLFQQKLAELGLLNDFARRILAALEEQFTWTELEGTITRRLKNDRFNEAHATSAADGIRILARSNYNISFAPDSRFSERVIFPATEAESRGIEDARFVQFREDDGRSTYYATYTAFDGRVILPQFLETRDFTRFCISTLNGPAVQNKGLALFPRRINGHYAMLSRQDGENIHLMYSDMLHFWYESSVIVRPTEPWEFVQLGNCGSPIETEAGWLVITHGVGPMRRYAIGAILLDLDNPARVIGRLRFPLLQPIENEREGYVPNVVYSCGGLVHAGKLILPYAMSDQSAGFATVPLAELVDAFD